MALRPYDDIDNAVDPVARQQSFFFFSTIALAMAIALIGVAGGFIYGDYYGRKHAQYENPELRQHYAGQCYSFIDSQLKKTIKSSFEKQGKVREQNERLEDIRNLLINLRMDVSGVGLNKKQPKPAERDKDLSNKKKVASTR